MVYTCSLHMGSKLLIIIIAHFYTQFSHEAQSAFSILLLPRSLDTFPCCTYSAQFPLPGEHSLSGIAACDNGTGQFKHNHLSHPAGSPFIHLQVHGDGKIRTWALSVRVE